MKAKYIALGLLAACCAFLGWVYVSDVDSKRPLSKRSFQAFQSERPPAVGAIGQESQVSQDRGQSIEPRLGNLANPDMVDGWVRTPDNEVPPPTVNEASAALGTIILHGEDIPMDIAVEQSLHQLIGRGLDIDGISLEAASIIESAARSAIDQDRTRAEAFVYSVCSQRDYYLRNEEALMEAFREYEAESGALRAERMHRLSEALDSDDYSQLLDHSANVTDGMTIEIADLDAMAELGILSAARYIRDACGELA